MLFIRAGCLQLLEISNSIDAPVKFSYQLKHDTMPITEPNLVTSLNPEKLSFDNFLCTFIHNIVHK